LCRNPHSISRVYLHRESETESVEKERGGCWMQNLAGTQGVPRARDDTERIVS
jgi:hypothetical protein